MLVRLMTAADCTNLIGIRRGLRGEGLHQKRPSQHLDFKRLVTFQLGC
jgi:hypothetical protein